MQSHSSHDAQLMRALTKPLKETNAQLSCQFLCAGYTVFAYASIASACARLKPTILIAMSGGGLKLAASVEALTRLAATFYAGV